MTQGQMPLFNRFPQDVIHKHIEELKKTALIMRSLAKRYLTAAETIESAIMSGEIPAPTDTKAAGSYLGSEYVSDLVSQFLKATCEVTANPKKSRVLLARLYDAFLNWTMNLPESKFIKKSLFVKAVEQNFQKVNIGGNVWFMGLSLKPKGG